MKAIIHPPLQREAAERTTLPALPTLVQGRPTGAPGLTTGRAAAENVVRTESPTEPNRVA